MSRLLADFTRCYSGDLPSCLERVILPEAGSYFALGRVRASFAPGLDPAAGRALLRGAATLSTRLTHIGGCSRASGRVP